MNCIPIAVVEVHQFVERADALMSVAEREELITFVATNPEAGVIVSETGGVRKLRWRLQGRGKRGGARVIYYFHSEQIPVFLLDIYAKNEKVNLTKTERNEIRKRIPILVERYQQRRAT